MEIDYLICFVCTSYVDAHKPIRTIEKYCSILVKGLNGIELHKNDHIWKPVRSTSTISKYMYQQVRDRVTESENTSSDSYTHVAIIVRVRSKSLHV